MACCALAVFILGQLYMAIEAAGRMLGFAPAAAAASNEAADWHWGAEYEVSVARHYRLPSFGARLSAAAMVCVASLATAMIYRPHLDHFDLAAYLADPAHICGSFLSSRS